MLAEAYVGLDNYLGAKKSILSSMKKYHEDSEFGDYFVLGSIEYKLGNKKESLDNLEKFIKLATASMENCNDDVRERNKKSIEISQQLINKLG